MPYVQCVLNSSGGSSSLSREMGAGGMRSQMTAGSSSEAVS